MALTVGRDNEVYQFDTVWLGPDEYTLPIQARYVAWGTSLACFLVATVILIPLAGNGPAGVLGSVVWALGLSVVLSRAIMLVVDNERPLRSPPALSSAETQTAMVVRVPGGNVAMTPPDGTGRTTAEDEMIRDREQPAAEHRAVRRLAPGCVVASAPAPVAVREVRSAAGCDADPVCPKWTPELWPTACGLEINFKTWRPGTDVRSTRSALQLIPTPRVRGTAVGGRPTGEGGGPAHARATSEEPEGMASEAASCEAAPLPAAHQHRQHRDRHGRDRVGARRERCPRLAGPRAQPGEGHPPCHPRRRVPSQSTPTS